MTRRERMEKRLERRRDWAEARDQRSDAAHGRVHQIMDGIPLGQPILVGHHSERRARRDIERIDAAAQESVASAKMADRHRQVASTLEQRLETTIFSDDEDAVERLTAKIAELEAKRDRMKEANAAYRAEHRAELKAMTPYERSQAVPYPSYSLTNLGARIRDAKQRIVQVQREQAQRESGERGGGRVMSARYGGPCADCGVVIERGEQIVWYRTTKEAVHATCPDK